VRERQLVLGGVPAFRVVQRLKQLGIVSQGARNRANAPDVLRMSPAGVVPAAIRV